MELEERITRLEAVVAKNENSAAWEYRVFKSATFVLFLFAVFAFVVWGSSELISFAVERFFHVAHAFGL